MTNQEKKNKTTENKYIRSTFSSEASYLLEICEEYFQCDLKERNRQKNNVNARIAFGTILRSRGHCLNDIGKCINRDHATILHYNKISKNYRNTDEDFRIKFELTYYKFKEKCAEINIEQVNFVENKDKENYYLALPYYNELLMNHINLLNKQKKELSLELEALKVYKNISTTSVSRVQNLIDIVKQRTRMGKEKEVENKLNRFYNSMQY
tara:strand:+ start:629 stop:1258 length:630 start_codon:yes stop_codon:yes gene_type:complete